MKVILNPVVSVSLSLLICPSCAREREGAHPYGERLGADGTEVQPDVKVPRSVCVFFLHTFKKLMEGVSG